MQLILPVISGEHEINGVLLGENPPIWYCVINLDKATAELMSKRLKAFNDVLKEDSQLVEHLYLGSVGEQYFGGSFHEDVCDDLLEKSTEDGKPVILDPIPVDANAMVVDEEGVSFRFRPHLENWNDYTLPIPPEAIEEALKEC